MADPTRSVARFAARHAPVAMVLVAMTVFTACSDSTAIGRGSSQLGFTTGSAPAGAASLDVAPITKNGHTLDLKQVTLVVERAQLKHQNNDACTGDEDEHDARWSGHSESCASAHIGPALVDLPLDGSVVTLPMDLLPAGTFDEIDFRVSLVRLVGTFDGNAFDVTLPVDAKTEVEFATPLVVTAGTPTSITINVPVTAWLTNADGSLVDPRQLLTNQTLAGAVKARIAASFHAFEDENHDGNDDHDHNRGGDGN
jgi:hypothetical protein